MQAKKNTMIHSMTGYGKSQYQLEGKVVTIEIRTLNSRQADVNMRLPYLFREKEAEIRSKLIAGLERGKIDLNISLETSDFSQTTQLNQTLAETYYHQLRNLAKSLGIDEGRTDYISLLARMPDVFKSTDVVLTEGEWEILFEKLFLAIEAVIIFRKEEGAVLKDELSNRIGLIEALLAKVEALESERMPHIRERILKELAGLAADMSIDKNRFEQEMIYWLEKIDFTEEKVRLKKHCRHFLACLDEPGGQGKKLGFIVQEIGREINTLGSKANHAEIQQLVVCMKDELEKVKEQLLNVL